MHSLKKICSLRQFWSPSRPAKPESSLARNKLPDAFADGLAGRLHSALPVCLPACLLACLILDGPITEYIPVRFA